MTDTSTSNSHPEPTSDRHLDETPNSHPELDSGSGSRIKSGMTGSGESGMTADAVKVNRRTSQLGSLPSRDAVLRMSEVKAAEIAAGSVEAEDLDACLLYTSPSPRDRQKSRMPSSA